MISDKDNQYKVWQERNVQEKTQYKNIKSNSETV